MILRNKYLARQLKDTHCSRPWCSGGHGASRMGATMRPHLTNSELDVMAVLWKLGSGTVTEVRGLLDKPLAYTSVLTVLRALESKGHVRHEEEGRAYRYYPAVEATEATDKALNRFVNKVYQGSREMLIARLLSDDSVSDAELRRIRSLLNKRLKGGKP